MPRHVNPSSKYPTSSFARIHVYIYISRISKFNSTVFDPNQNGRNKKKLIDITDHSDSLKSYVLILHTGIKNLEKVNNRYT